MSTPMAVRLRVSGSAPHGPLGHLYDLLRTEEALRGHVSPAPDPGGISDALAVALDGDGSVGTFAAVLARWLRRSRPDITIEIESTAHGGRITVDARHVADVERLLTQLLQPRAAG
jgi:membrane-associated two-gene conflict system component 1 (EACC1)